MYRISEVGLIVDNNLLRNRCVQDFRSGLSVDNDLLRNRCVQDFRSGLSVDNDLLRNRFNKVHVS